ncbi:TPA: hypothetical protein ACGIK9_002932 [Acinetobacter baumannii]|uniref:hypothetical protein n=1 Tax=Acinetobacter baumannii TaxID=470 RepID=UPI00338FBA05
MVTTNSNLESIDSSIIAPLQHILKSEIERYLDAGENRFFIYNSRKLKSSLRVTNLIFPFVLRMVEYQLSSYIGKKQDNFIYLAKKDKRNGNTLEVIGINKDNPPLFILVSSALLYVFKVYFEAKADKVDLYNYIAAIN